jgi:TolA-binding protein
VTWLFVIVVILVLGAGFAAALGLLGDLPESEQDLRPDTLDGEPAFDVVVRGYRMDEVDAQLESMRDEIDELQQELQRAKGDDSA